MTPIDAIHREVGSRQAESGEVVSVLLRRDYTATVEDVWDAMTDPFAPDADQNGHEVR